MLTDQQKEFVLHYVSTPGAVGNATEAARMAGYSPSTAREQGYQLLRKPHIRAAVENANRERLSAPLATIAIECLAQIMNDPTAPLRTRVDAAKAILDRGGYAACSKREEVDPLRKPLNEMSLDELELAIEIERTRLLLLEHAPRGPILDNSEPDGGATGGD